MASSNGAGANGGKKLGSTVPFIINGEEIVGEDTFDVTSPTNGEVLHQCGDADDAMAKKAVEAAAKAFPSWSQTTPAQRRGILLKAADLAGKRAQELMSYQKTETGASDAWAAFNIFLLTECLLDIASRIMAIEGKIPTTQDPSHGALILKEPYGVILAIAPW